MAFPRLIMSYPICNFLDIEESNELINIGYEQGMCDSTYLGHIELPVELPDKDDKFFGTRIREVIRLLKEIFKKRA